MIDWDETTHDERACLHGPAKLLKQSLGMSWEDAFLAAFGLRDRVKANYEDNLRKGRIAAAKAYKLHAWIARQDAALAARAEDDILAQRKTAQPGTAPSWLAMVARAAFGPVRTIKFDALTLVERSRRLPVDATILKLREEFVFEVACPCSGMLTGFQESGGQWFQLVIGESASLPVDVGATIIPLDEQGKPDPLFESAEAGVHDFVFVLVPDDQVSGLLPPPNAQPVPASLLDDIAHEYSRTPEGKRRAFRIRVLFKAG